MADLHLVEGLFDDGWRLRYEQTELQCKSVTTHPYHWLGEIYIIQIRIKFNKECCLTNTSARMLADEFDGELLEVKQPLTMCSDIGEGSRCCAFYSAVGVIFTLWCGIIINKQSFFIAGIDDPVEAQASAFGAMGMFGVTFLASIVGIWYDSSFKQETVSNSNSAEGYQLSTGDTPTYGTGS